MKRKVYFAEDGEIFRRGNPRLMRDMLTAFARGESSYTIKVSKKTSFPGSEMEGAKLSPVLVEYRAGSEKGKMSDTAGGKAPVLMKYYGKETEAITDHVFYHKHVDTKSFKGSEKVLFYGLGLAVEWSKSPSPQAEPRPNGYLLAADDKCVTRLKGYPGPNYPDDSTDVHPGDPQAEEACRYPVSYPALWVKTNPNILGSTVGIELGRMISGCLDRLSPSLLARKKYSIPKQFAERMKGHNPERFPALYRERYTVSTPSVPAPRKVWELSTGGVQFLFSVLLKILQETDGKELTASEITRISKIDFIVRPQEITKPWKGGRGGKTYAGVERGVREVYATSWELEGLRKIINPETDIKETARVVTECRIVGKLETFQTATSSWMQYNVDSFFLNMCKDQRMLSKTLTTVFTDIKAKPGSDLYWAALHVHAEVVTGGDNYHISSRTLYNTLPAKVSGKGWKDLGKRDRWDYEKAGTEKNSGSVGNI